MQYFGVPTCPYCKKRVNLIRTWSLKRQGEYQCPRCGGISNIFLSPLIYVFALLAVFAGGAVYFFHKFVLDDISLSTALQVLIPFAVFFLVSLFLVYLAKPVIKKVPRAELDKKRRGKSNFENRRMPAENEAQTGRVFYESEDYVPQMDYRTGPMPLPQGGDEDMKIHAPAPRNGGYVQELQQTSVVDLPAVRLPEEEPLPVPPQDRPQAVRRETPAARRAPQPGARAGDLPARKAPRQAVQEEPVRIREEPPARRRASSQRSPEVGYQGAESVRRAPVPPQSAEQPVSHVVSSVEIPSVGDDFFAKYDDPAYIERRLQELNEDRNG